MFTTERRSDDMATAECIERPLTRHFAIPPLEPGDHLTREEFERRYDAMPDLKKAELIEGIVYMPSPVAADRHGTPHAQLMTIVGIYSFSTPGTRIGDNTTVRFDEKNEPQPDVLLLIMPGFAGQAVISPDGYIEGAPEFAAEVASSSVSIDLHAKKRAYERFGVREYVVWRVLDEAIDWFVLRNGQFEPLSPDAEGRVKSEVFPGLWLDPAALIRGDVTTVMQILQEGLASAEHAAFVGTLRARANGMA
jgi:Uma2 family endonuclease